MPLDLLVPYTDKDQAKSLGAFWIPERKTWVIPDLVTEIAPFKTWVPFQNGCIVRKPYFVCLSKTDCWKCGKEAPMLALGARNYFHYDEGTWWKISEPSLFSWVLALDEPVIRYIRKTYPFFKPSYSRTLQMSYYGNTCIACGTLQGDFFHHEEPGGAFFPDPFLNIPTGIILKNIDLSFDYHINASFGGMAYDDIFYPQNNPPFKKEVLSLSIVKPLRQ